MQPFSSMKWGRQQTTHTPSKSFDVGSVQFVPEQLDPSHPGNQLISPRLSDKLKQWGYEDLGAPGRHIRTMSYSARGGSPNVEGRGTPQDTRSNRSGGTPHVSVKVQEETSTTRHPIPPSPSGRNRGSPSVPVNPSPRSSRQKEKSASRSSSASSDDFNSYPSSAPRSSQRTPPALPKGSFTAPTVSIPHDGEETPVTRTSRPTLSPSVSKEGIGGLGMTPVTGTNPLAPLGGASTLATEDKSSFIVSMKNLLAGKANEVAIPNRGGFPNPTAAPGQLQWEGREGRKPQGHLSGGLYSLDPSPREQGSNEKYDRRMKSGTPTSGGAPPESPGYATFGPQDVLSPARMCLPIALFVVLNTVAAGAVVAMVLLGLPLVAIAVVSGVWGLLLLLNIVLSCFPDFVMRRALHKGRRNTLKGLEERLIGRGEEAMTVVVHGKILCSIAGTIESPRNGPDQGPVVMETVLQSSLYFPQTLMKQTLATDFIFQDREGKRAVVRVREACDQGMLTALVTQREVMSVSTSRKLPGFLDADWREKERYLLHEQPELSEDELVVSRGLVVEGQDVAIMGTLRESVTHPGQLVIEPLLGAHNATPGLMIGGCIPFCIPSWTSGLVIADNPASIF